MRFLYYITGAGDRIVKTVSENHEMGAVSDSLRFLVLRHVIEEIIN
jgi:hypothetical protein